MKFGRIYSMTIQVSETQTVVVEYPLTLEFSITRNTLASANQATFRLKNLKADTRTQIYHDRFDTGHYRGIILRAGYEKESPLPVIFQGNIQQASSYRQGVDWITEIEAFDGGYGIQNGQVSQTVPAGWSLPQIIKQVLSTLPHTGIGQIGDLSQQNSRGITLMGNSWDVTNRIAIGQNTNAFIDSEVANLLKDDEYIAVSGGIPLITSDNGILNSPRRFESILKLDILFEPRIVLGQLVQLDTLSFSGLALAFSNTQQLAVNNGQYKVMGFSHRGTISGAVCGEAVTNVDLFLGTQRLIPIARAA
jgi:hypothetical protein